MTLSDIDPGYNHDIPLDTITADVLIATAGEWTDRALCLTPGMTAACLGGDVPGTIAPTYVRRCAELLLLLDQGVVPVEPPTAQAGNQDLIEAVGRQTAAGIAVFVATAIAHGEW